MALARQEDDRLGIIATQLWLQAQTACSEAREKVRLAESLVKAAQALNPQPIVKRRKRKARR